MPRRSPPLWNDEPPQDFDPTDAPAVPLAPDAPAAPAGHLSFNAFWSTLKLPDTPENDRLRELFYEWLGQHGFDVHDRDEPTILGDRKGWRQVWARYLDRRLLR